MKRPGHCTLCNEPVMEIVRKHTKGKKKGEPIELGGWLESAYRVGFLLSDGSVAEMSFCKKCLENGVDNLYPEIWEKVKERFLWEEENLNERTPLQQAKVDRELERIFALEILGEVGRKRPSMEAKAELMRRGDG